MVMSLIESLTRIKNAVYGREVREAIHDGVFRANQIADEALEVQAYDGNSLADVTLAKDGLSTLDARIRRDVNNLENKKADKSEVTAQLAQKVGGGEKAELEDLSPAVLSAIEGGDGTTFNLLSVPQNYSVTPEKLSQIEFTAGNLYKANSFVPDKYIHAQGYVAPAVGFGYGKVQIEPETVYSIFLPTGVYTGAIGAVGFFQGETVKSHVPVSSELISGSYKGESFISVTSPPEVDNMRITNRRTGASAFDDSQTMIVVEGNDINDDILDAKITSLFGLPLRDSLAKNQEPPNPYAEINWGAVGDSLTERNSRSTHFYHDYIKDEIGINVINYGASGTGYKRRDDINNAFYQRVLNISEDLDVVTFFGSLNDLASEVPLGNVGDATVDSIAGAINKTIDNLYSVMPTVPLGIISPTPWQSSNLSDSENQATKYVELLENICKARGIPFLNLYHSSGLRPWEPSYRPLMYSRDDGGGTHPDENGHKLIYPQIREFLKSLL